MTNNISAMPTKHPQLRSRVKDFIQQIPQTIGKAWRLTATIGAGFVTILTIFVGINVLVDLLTLEPITIAPISTPKYLTESGITPEVAADILRKSMTRTISTDMSPQVLLSAELPNIVIPSMGLNASGVANWLRSFFNMHTPPTISGRFTILDGNLQLRLSSQGVDFFISSPKASPDQAHLLLESAAPWALRKTWPIYIAMTEALSDSPYAMSVANEVTQSGTQDAAALGHILKALISVKENNFAAAQQSASAAITKARGAQTRSLAHAVRASLLAKENDSVSAKKEFEIAQKAAGQDIFVKSLVKILIEQGWKGKEVDEIKRIAANRPLDLNLQNSVANLMSLFGNIDDAIAQYKLIVAVDPNNATAHLRIASLLHKKQDYVSAASHYRKLIAIDPTSLQSIIARLGLGSALFDDNKYNDAASEFRKILDFPQITIINTPPEVNSPYVNIHSEARQRLAEVLSAQHKVEESISELNSIITTEPDSHKARFILSGILLEAGRVEEAEAQIAIVINSKFANLQPGAHYLLATIFDRREKLKEAAEEYRKAIELAPEWVAGHSELGRVLFLQNDLDSAESSILTAIGLDDAEAIPHQYLSWILRKRGKVDQATEEGKKAVERRPSDMQIRMNLASLLSEKRETDAAIEEWRNIVRMDPNSNYQIDLALELTNKAQRGGREEKASILKEACTQLASMKKKSVEPPELQIALKRINSALRKKTRCFVRWSDLK